jgi:hypothetical protein
MQGTAHRARKPRSLSPKNIRVTKDTTEHEFLQKTCLAWRMDPSATQLCFEDGDATVGAMSLLGSCQTYLRNKANKIDADNVEYMPSGLAVVRINADVVKVSPLAATRSGNGPSQGRGARSKTCTARVYMRWTATLNHVGVAGAHFSARCFPSNTLHDAAHSHRHAKS